MATIAELKQQHAEPRLLPDVQAGFFDLQSFELMQRIAKGFASSTLVPKEFQNNVANCMIALNLVKRMGADPLMVMQHLIVIHGRPTWSAQFLIATANICGRFTAIRFEFFGNQNDDTWGCRAWAIEASSGERLVGADITIGLAKKEGWYGRTGSKWQSMPQQMLIYRAGAWWVRAYAPELSMGLMTAEEAIDIDALNARKRNDGVFEVPLETLKGEQQQDAPAGAGADGQGVSMGNPPEGTGPEASPDAQPAQAQGEQKQAAPRARRAAAQGQTNFE